HDRRRRTPDVLRCWSPASVCVPARHLASGGVRGHLMLVIGVPPAAASAPRVSFGEAFRFWLKLGFINFGGPAGQIAIMHRELVDQKRWVPEPLFLRALNFSMLLPGPEATELAIYVAWRMHGIAGGIVAGSFFVIPSVFVLLLQSWLSVAYTDVPVIRGLLYGVQPVVMA